MDYDEFLKIKDIKAIEQILLSYATDGYIEALRITLEKCFTQEQQRPQKIIDYEQAKKRLTHHSECLK